MGRIVRLTFVVTSLAATMLIVSGSGHASPDEPAASHMTRGPFTTSITKPIQFPQQPTLDWSRARVMSILDNANAREHIRRLESLDPQFRAAQLRTAAGLQSKGFQPTDLAWVATIEVPRPQLAPNQLGFRDVLSRFLVATLNAEEFDGYEVIAQSWDDGNHSTWEGSVYARNLSTGEWASSYEQQQLPPEPYTILWGDPAGQSFQPRYQCRKQGSACGYCGQNGTASCNLQRAIVARWDSCMLGAGACAFSGPNWPGCVAVACWGNFFIGWLMFTKEHFNQCWLDEAERQACEG